MLKELQNFGLSEKEANVYLASLELGRATVQDISKKAKVNRATTYVQLESLKSRGLVSQISVGKKTYFMAEAPENVLKILEKDKIEVLYKEKELKKIMPNLQTLYNARKDRPNVRFYEGFEGINSLHEEMLKSKFKHFMGILPGKFLPKNKYEDKQGLFEKVAATVEDYRIIYIDEEKNKVYEDFVKQLKKVKVKRLSPKKLDINIEIAILDNKIMINRFDKEPLGIIIEDKLIAQSFMTIIEIFWKMAS